MSVSALRPSVGSRPIGSAHSEGSGARGTVRDWHCSSPCELGSSAPVVQGSLSSLRSAK
jgi:hypothetical protein